MKNQISRRRFMLRSVEGTIAASFVAPALFAAPTGSPRLGIIGLGDCGTRVLNSCLDHCVNVAALCDIDAIALRRSGARIPHATLCPDIERMAALPDVDAVAIATPRASSIAEALLHRGKHVFLASVDQPNLQIVDRLARLAQAQSLEIGLAPYDTSWDFDALNCVLAAPLNQPTTRTRLSLLGSTADYAQMAEFFGLDLLHHAVNFARNRNPSRVHAVSSRGPMGSGWSASFLIDRESRIDLHAQAVSTLAAGNMSIEIETIGPRVSCRTIVDSDRPASMPYLISKTQVAGLPNFLVATANPAMRTRSSVRVLTWSALLKNALQV